MQTPPVGLGVAEVLVREVDREVVVVSVVELVVDVGGGVVVDVVLGVELVVGLVVGFEVVVVTEVVGGAVVGLTGVPRDGVAEQVVTCSPAVREARASGPSGSDGSSGTVPTYGLKL